MNKLLKNVLATVLLAFTLSFLVNKTVVANDYYTDEDLLNFLKNEGYEKVRFNNGEGILFEYYGRLYHAGHHLNYFFVRSIWSEGCSLDIVNRYNYYFVKSKAYIMKDGNNKENCYIETILPSFSKTTKEDLREFYSSFAYDIIPISAAFMVSVKNEQTPD